MHCICVCVCTTIKLYVSVFVKKKEKAKKTRLGNKKKSKYFWHREDIYIAKVLYSLDYKQEVYLYIKIYIYVSVYLCMCVSSSLRVYLN